MTATSRCRQIVRDALCGFAVLAAAAWVTPAVAGDAERWRALFVTAPPAPATLDEARSRIVARRQDGAVIVQAGDPAWLLRAQEAQALIAPVSAASAEQFKATMERFNQDPQAARLAKGMEKALDDAERAMRRGEHGPIRSDDPAVDRMLRDLDKPPDLSRMSPIAAYAMERLRAQPNAGTFRQQLHEQRRRFARLHAELDAAAPRDTAAVTQRVRRHQELAQQQLQEAASLHAAAREALQPAVEKMALLAAQAEQRGASAGERSQAYQWLKGVIELLDAIARTTIEDVGFWAAVQPAAAAANPARTTYVLSLAPDVDLLADGVLPQTIVPYPRGRIAAAWPPPAASAPR